jgi:integrase
VKLDKPYLTRSRGTGVYGYRRKVSPKHSELFGGRLEIKKTFKTKDIKQALYQLEDMDQWFEDVISTKGLKEFSATTPQSQKQRMIAQDLKIRGLLPDDIDVRRSSRDPEYANYVLYVSLHYAWVQEMRSFTDGLRKLARERKQPVELADMMRNPPEHLKGQRQRMTELEAQQSAIPPNPHIEKFEAIRKETGHTAVRVAMASHRNPKSTNPEVEAIEQYRLDVLKGEKVTLPATWKNAVEEYFTGQQDEVRNKSQQRQWRSTTWSACERLSAHLVHGMNTKLQDIGRADVEDAVRSIWSNPSTRKRGARIYQAVINSWNIRYPEQPVPNMFLRLVSDAAVKNAKRDRRSFSPNEYTEVWRLVDAEPDMEIRLLATLSLYAGIPSGEVAGLDIYDLRLDGNSPHMKIRNNDHRFLGKKRYERSIPLVGFVLDRVCAYASGRNFAGDGRLFPSFFRVDGSINNDRLFKRMNRFVVHQIKTDRRLVSWYSGRHTFKDICEVVGVSNSHSRYLMGHVDPGGGSHKEYGTKPPVTALITDMEKVLDWRNYQWGDYDQ